MATQHKLNNKDAHNCNSNNETKDVLEATCIVFKYFIKYLHLKEWYAIQINLIDYLLCKKLKIKMVFDVHLHALKIQNKHHCMHYRFVMAIQKLYDG